MQRKKLNIRIYSHLHCSYYSNIILRNNTYGMQRCYRKSAIPKDTYATMIF